MLDKATAAAGAAGIYWTKARDLVSRWPGTFIVLSAAAIVTAGVWL